MITKPEKPGRSPWDRNLVPVVTRDRTLVLAQRYPAKHRRVLRLRSGAQRRQIHSARDEPIEFLRDLLKPLRQHGDIWQSSARLSQENALPYISLNQSDPGIRAQNRYGNSRKAAARAQIAGGIRILGQVGGKKKRFPRVLAHSFFKISDRSEIDPGVPAEQQLYVSGESILLIRR